MNWLRRLLRERGARSALIVYDGGNDEGWITALSWSEQPLAEDAVAGVVVRQDDVWLLVENSAGKEIPTRWIAEQHVAEDLGFLPSLSQWLSTIVAEPWMMRSRPLSRELEKTS